MADINGMRTGFVLDKDGNRILPITHMSLIIGSDGKSILAELEETKAGISSNAEAIAGVDQRVIDLTDRLIEIDGKVLNANDLISEIGNRISSVQTFEDLVINETLADGAICYVVDDKKYYSYTTADGWKEMVTSGDGTGGGGGYIDDIYSHIWIGTEPPENSNMIWVDTNTDGVVESEDDMGLLRQVLSQLADMQAEINSLRRRVKYLEEHGTFDPNEPETPDIPVDEDDIILLEDGSSILLEDDSGELLLEVQIDDSIEEDPDEVILLEDGTPLSLEDGSGDILMEIQIENAPSKPSEEDVDAVLLEDGTHVLYENGEKILLEMRYQ